MTRSPTLVPVGPVCTRSPLAASARAESACAGQASASSSASARRAQLSASTSAPASSVTPSVPSVPAASSSSCGWPAMRRAAASARCWLRPPRPGCCRQRTVDSPPHTHSLRGGQRQLVREARRERGELRRRSAAARRARRGRARRPRAATAATASSIEATHRAHDAVGALLGRSHQARADHARIVGGDVGDEQGAGRTALEARGEPSALDTRERHAARVQLADGDAGGEPRAVELLEVGERDAVGEHLDEARGASGDQEQRLDGARAARRPTRAGARRLRASARPAAGCAPSSSSTRPRSRSSGEPLQITGDDERALRSRFRARRGRRAPWRSAALPTAASHTGAPGAPARAASVWRTQRRPSTRRSPACSSSSSSARRGSDRSDAAQLPRTTLRRPGRSRRASFGRVRALELQSIEILRGSRRRSRTRRRSRRCRTPRCARPRACRRR